MLIFNITNLKRNKKSWISETLQSKKASKNDKEENKVSLLYNNINTLSNY